MRWAGLSRIHPGSGLGVLVRDIGNHPSLWRGDSGARAAEPPVRTFVEATCRLTGPTEHLCHDGRDNDEDCLTDGEDPDCDQQPESRGAH